LKNEAAAISSANNVSMCHESYHPALIFSSAVPVHIKVVPVHGHSFPFRTMTTSQVQRKNLPT
jgi:hypothetical protein